MSKRTVVSSNTLRKRRKVGQIYFQPFASFASILIVALKQAETIVIEPEQYIQRLPYELLAEIFLSCVKSAPGSEYRVASTCRTWRQIAIQSPTLWDRISVFPSPEGM